MTFITNMWFETITNVFITPIMTNYTLFQFFFNLLILIPSEMSTLSYCSILRTHINTHLKKIVDNT